MRVVAAETDGHRTAAALSASGVHALGGAAAGNLVVRPASAEIRAYPANQ